MPYPGLRVPVRKRHVRARMRECGVVFVGPPADVIERMGSKIAARALMLAAGVPVVPGVTAEDQSDEGILGAAERVGFPVLVKASAGGGGKGMRVVRDHDSAGTLVPAARREAIAAFGDGTLYVERLIERPRHIEVQIFGDTHGNVVPPVRARVHDPRRHQKVTGRPVTRADARGPRRDADSRRAAARAAITSRGHDRIPARRCGRRGALLTFSK